MPITVITGEPGSGKTFVATWMAIRLAKRGREVATNWPIDHPGIRRFAANDLFKLRSERGGLLRVFVDEAQLQWHSRMWASLPPEVYQRWNMVRRGGIDLFLLTQDFDNLDTTLRRACHYVAEVEPHWKSFSAWREEDQHPLTFAVKTYRKRDYRTRGARPIRKRTVWWSSAVARAYDTLEEFDVTWHQESPGGEIEPPPASPASPPPPVPFLLSAQVENPDMKGA